MSENTEPGMPWFAVRVRGRSEPAAAAALRAKGFRPYLPTCVLRKRYSDRFKVVEAPLFPGYLFCPMVPEHTAPVLSIPTVRYILGDSRGPVPVCAEEIAALQRVAGAGALPTRYLASGCRVRISFGNLAGVEGILVRSNSRVRVVLSVEMLGKSVAVEVDEDQIELI